MLPHNPGHRREEIEGLARSRDTAIDAAAALDVLLMASSGVLSDVDRLTLSEAVQICDRLAIGFNQQIESLLGTQA